MIPIIGIVGKSGSGKTTVARKIIAELKNRGHKVAAIKHTTHAVDIDQPGKDSDLLHQAGSEAVALASKNTVAMYMHTTEQMTPADICAKFFPEVDLVIVEGFGDAPIPRIAVVRKAVPADPPDKQGLIGIVTDVKMAAAVPLFSLDQTAEIADLCETYIRRKGPKRDVKLYMDGRPIFIKPFIKDFFLQTIAAMVNSLKGTQGARRIQIVIDKPAGEPDEEERGDGHGKREAGNG